jgi:hypothetical protein
MKKTLLRRSSAAAGRMLKLSHETIRTLRVDELARAVSGCDTTSDTTDKTTTSVRTNSGSAVDCATKLCI